MFAPFSLQPTGLILALEMILGCAGAAYGTAKSGIGIAGVGTFRPDLIMKVLDQSYSSIAQLLTGLDAFLVFDSCCHVRYYCSLRSRHCSTYRRRYGPSAVTELQLVYRLHAPRQWVERWRLWIGSRLCNRYRWGSGREVIHAAVAGVRRNGPDTDLRRGPWLVWVDCGSDPEFEELRLEEKTHGTNCNSAEERASSVGLPCRAYLHSSVLVNVQRKSKRLPASVPPIA